MTDTKENVLIVNKYTPILVSVGVLAFIYCLKHAYVITSNGYLFTLFDNAENIFYIILAISILCSKKFSKVKLISISIVTCFLAINLFGNGYAALLRAFLLIVAVKDIEYKKICGTLYKAMIIGFLVVVLMYILGISDAGILRRGRIAIGFSSANVCSYIIQTMCLLRLYLRKDCAKKNEIFIYIVVAIFDFMLIGSRNSALIIGTSPLIIYLVREFFKHKQHRIFRWIFTIIPVICLFLTMFSTILYDKSKVIQMLNIILSARIFLNYYNYNRYGLTLFGQKLSFNDGRVLFNSVTNQYSTYNTIDSSYMCLLLQFGIVPTVIALFFCCFLYKRLFQKNQFELIAIFSMICFFGLFESSMIEIIIAFPLLALLAKF